MELEFLDIDRRNAWVKVFQEIRNESSNFSYSFKDAKKTENKNLNRYRDVNPFDHSRVRLQRGERDYINASLVNAAPAGRSYILTQGPLPVTTGHFWLMVWEQKSKAILMLNRVIEKNAVKCHQYWPIGSKNGGDQNMLLTDVKLQVTFISQREELYFIVREFLISDLESLESRVVLQFHYTTWPDFGVPESPAAFLNFLFSVRESGVLNSNVGPAVVHCSAGIGRSGTFCLVDSCLVLIEKNNDPISINIRQLLLEMRRYRMGLIQTPDQLRFSYLAILEGAKKLLPHKINLNNVPLQNENIVQANLISRSMELTDENILNNIHNGERDHSPPPVPPRSACGVEDPPVTIKPTSDINDEQNNTVDICTYALQKEHETIKETERALEVEDIAQNNSEDICELSPTNCNVATKHTNPGPSGSDHQESSTELRKRARKEREDKTAAIVQNIKKKQKETELWEKRRSIIKRFSLGLVLVIGIGYIVYKFNSKG